MENIYLNFGQRRCATDASIYDPIMCSTTKAQRPHGLSLEYLTSHQHATETLPRDDELVWSAPTMMNWWSKAIVTLRLEPETTELNITRNVRSATGQTVAETTTQ